MATLLAGWGRREHARLARRYPAPVAVALGREQDAGVPLIVVNDVELYYESRGAGALLVVLGGLGLDVSEMGRFCPAGRRLWRKAAAARRGGGSARAAVRTWPR